MDKAGTLKESCATDPTWSSTLQVHTADSLRPQITPVLIYWPPYTLPSPVGLSSSFHSRETETQRA
jgi:hypothetical protein